MGDIIPELFVRNIPFTTTNEQLQSLLESVSGRGSLRSCEIQRKGGTIGPSKGYAFVKCNSDAATRLLLASRPSLSGRVLKVLTSTRVQRNPRYSDADFNGKLYIGSFVDSDTMAYLWCTSGSDVRLDFFYSALKLSFTVGKFKMEAPFQSIASVEYRKINGLNESLLFQLYWPPLLFEKRQLLSIFDMLDEDAWSRITDFTDGKAIGQSTVYCFELSGTLPSELNELMKKLNDYRLGSYSPVYETLRLTTGRPFASFQEVVPVLSTTFGWRIPLDVEFKVNYLVQDGYISPATLTSAFFRLLSENPVDISLTALARFEKLRTTCLEPVSKLEAYLRLPSNRKVRESRSMYGGIQPEDGHVYVKRFMVTPTKIYFLGPELDMSNRITRCFSRKIDRFVRVTFTEEDFDKLNSNALAAAQPLLGLGVTYTSIYNRVRAVLLSGIQFGGMKFEFLAFSASQLRESSVWMFSSDGETSARDIRAWMGDFMSIRNVAKCAARMGQSFSTSTPTLEVSPWDLPDIMHQTYCFSDGIGKISKEFAIQVSEKCSSAKTVPSAFQIRYGGYKGVVAVDPSSPFKLSLRPSMNKFSSTQTGLDVLSWTRYIPCYLNRQVITLLSTLGVADRVFERMQEQVVEKLDIMFRDRESALEVLKTFYAGDCHRFLVDMLRAGYQPGGEPYLTSLLHAFRDYQLMMLQTKSRILVPDGRCLMGCLDETRALDYGQCFLQVSPPPQAEVFGLMLGGEFQTGRGVRGRDRAMVVRGPVVVAKNPCLHPGDVFTLEAVDIPELHHMVDCIVFPQRGRRPHPNECSGSDLDGDLYFASWDRGLIPPTRETPMEYEPAKAIQLDHPVTVEEIHKFFADFLTNDSLGVICNAHTALADSEQLQAKDPKCLELAKLSSIAVDFPKTGVPATITPELRPKKYPDFMEKRDRPSYVSERVIGKLYRSIKSHRLEKVEAAGGDREYDARLLVPGYKDHLRAAEYYQSCYDEKLTGLLNQYDISEAEAMSGCVRSLSRYYSNKRRQGEVKERIGMAAKALVKEARGWFDETASEEAKAMASAWYHVTYDPMRRRREQGEVDLLSFPWVVCDKLLERAVNELAQQAGYH